MAWMPLSLFTQLLIPLSLTHQALSFIISIPTPPTKVAATATAVYNRQGGDQQNFALLLVQVQPTQTFSVISHVTSQGDEGEHTVAFAAPTPGVFQVMVAPADSTPAKNIPSSFRGSAPFQVFSSGNDLQSNSDSSQSSSSSNAAASTSTTTSSDQNEQSSKILLTSTSPSSTAASSSSSNGQQTVTVTASPSSAADISNPNSPPPVQALIGGIMGALVLTLIIAFLIWYNRRRRGRNQVSRRIKGIGFKGFNLRSSSQASTSRDDLVEPYMIASIGYERKTNALRDLSGPGSTESESNLLGATMAGAVTSTSQSPPVPPKPQISKKKALAIQMKREMSWESHPGGQGRELEDVERRGSGIGEDAPPAYTSHCGHSAE